MLRNQTIPDEIERVKKLDGCGQSISSLGLTAQVTSIRFIGKQIFAGIGNQLHVFKKSHDSSSWENSFSIEVFSGQCIHGIVFNNERDVTVFGGRLASILHFQSLNQAPKLNSIRSFKVLDWILDCVWLSNGAEIAFLTANNSLLLYNVSLDCPKLLAMNVCMERCILYSGKLLNSAWTEIVVLAGTVFSTIVIWINKGDAHEKEICHKLVGHNGVIFCVEYCSRLRRICSTSDDRSVRIWDVEFSDPDFQEWKECKITLTYTLYGHLARVWKCRFINDGKFVSVGEDSRICLWNKDGSLCNQWSGHQNGEIWSLDTSDTLQFVGTGGSDGGINMWPLSSETLPYPLTFDDTLPSMNPRCVGLLGTGCPFLVTVEGDIFLFTCQKWKHCSNEPSLRSYCVHSVTPDKTRVAFGSITGIIIVYCYKNENLVKVFESTVCNGRIFNAIWLSNDSLITSEPNGALTIWSYSSECTSLLKIQDFILPPSKERWITSSAANYDFLVCGDRAGSLFLYTKHENKRNPIFTAKRVHGCKGVTCVKILNSRILTTGRDGKYREFLIVDDELLLVTCSKLKLDWAAAIIDNTTLGKILLCFHEKFLIVWSIEQRRPIMKIDCGGGHRSWDLLVDSEAGFIYVTYIKGKSVNYCKISIEDVACQTVLQGSAPKTINAASIVGLPSSCKMSKPIETAQYVLLGSEDTTLRLVSFQGESFSEHSILQNHLSSVRTVHCCEDMIVSAGGRGQLVIWKVICSNDSLEIIFLKSYSILQQSSKSNVNTPVNDDAEMRIMSVQIHQKDHKSFLVAAGCSDGVLRLFSFNCGAKLFSPLREIKTEHCLLDLHFIELQNKLFVLSTGTSGVVSFHQIHDTELHSSENQTHFSVSDCGINCCDYKFVGDQLLLSTGGDDAVLRVLLLVEESNVWLIEDQWENNKVHTCQISGVRILDDLLMSVGLDQRLSIFSWELNVTGLTIKLLKTVELSIPDIHGMLVFRKFDSSSYNIIVHGLGTQLLKFSPYS